MKQIAIVSNSEGIIIELKNVPDDFDASSVRQMYGPDKPTRICTVVRSPAPSFDFATQQPSPLDPVITDTTVTYGFEITTIAAVVPAQVENWQLEEEMASRGLIAPLEAAIGGITDDTQREKAQARWGKKPWIRRADPLIEEVRLLLRKTPAEVDDIFICASRRQ